MQASSVSGPPTETRYNVPPDATGPQERVEFLRKDLMHLFDDQGIDASAYDTVRWGLELLQQAVKRADGGWAANQQTHGYEKGVLRESMQTKGAEGLWVLHAGTQHTALMRTCSLTHSEFCDPNTPPTHPLTHQLIHPQVVEFRDPITKYDSLSGYLFNITMLKKVGPRTRGTGQQLLMGCARLLRAAAEQLL